MKSKSFSTPIRAFTGREISALLLCSAIEGIADNKWASLWSAMNNTYTAYNYVYEFSKSHHCKNILKYRNVLHQNTFDMAGGNNANALWNQFKHFKACEGDSLAQRLCASQESLFNMASKIQFYAIQDWMKVFKTPVFIGEVDVIKLDMLTVYTHWYLFFFNDKGLKALMSAGDGNSTVLGFLQEYQKEHDRDVLLRRSLEEFAQEVLL